MDYTDCKTTLIAHSHGTYRFMGRDAKWDFINLTCIRRKACSLSSFIVHNVFNFEQFSPSLYSVALQNWFRSMYKWMYIDVRLARIYTCIPYGDVTIARKVLQISRPILQGCGLWTGRDLYRAIPDMTQDLGFHGLTRRDAMHVVSPGVLRTCCRPRHLLSDGNIWS